MRPVQYLEPLHVARRRSLERRRHHHAPAEHPVARFFPPPRQHERMNLEGVRHGLHLDALQLTQFHGLALELQAVLSNLHGTDTTWH